MTAAAKEADKLTALHAYFKGNGTFPQFNSGINLTTLANVLMGHSTLRGWVEISTSDEGRDAAIRAMNRFHNARGVNVHTAEAAKEGDRVIDPKYLRSLNFNRSARTDLAALRLIRLLEPDQTTKINSLIARIEQPALRQSNLLAAADFVDAYLESGPHRAELLEWGTALSEFLESGPVQQWAEGKTESREPFQPDYHISATREFMSLLIPYLRSRYPGRTDADICRWIELSTGDREFTIRPANYPGLHLRR